MKLNIDGMNIDELKELTKKIVENMVYTGELIAHLQDRILKIELHLFDKADC